MKKILAILVGIIVIGVGIFLLVHTKELSKRCTIETVGTVTEIKVEESIEDDDEVIRTTYTYYPVIEYTVGDKTISKQSNTGSGSSKYNVNDKVDILYNPDNVEEYIIKGDTTSNFVGILFIVVGAAVVLVEICLTRKKQ